MRAAVSCRGGSRWTGTGCRSPLPGSHGVADGGFEANRQPVTVTALPERVPRQGMPDGRRGAVHLPVRAGARPLLDRAPRAPGGHPGGADRAADLAEPAGPRVRLARLRQRRARQPPLSRCTRAPPKGCGSSPRSSTSRRARSRRRRCSGSPTPARPSICRIGCTRAAGSRLTALRRPHPPSISWSGAWTASGEGSFRWRW